MSRNGKVIVAMSGGVDSSVAAALLKEQGYECLGVFLRVGAEPPEDAVCALPERQSNGEATEVRSHDASLDPGGRHGASAARQGSEGRVRRLKHGCCSANDALDARLIAGHLGIPFYALNFKEDFERIIDYFANDYAAARTPNPCVMCNIHVKFGRLLKYADLVDAEYIATGHYARIVRQAGDGRDKKDATDARGERGQSHAVCLKDAQAHKSESARLARARNLAKDQSYVLFGISRRDLGRCIFPLGEIEDKSQVRRIAASLGLHTHDKPDSQEICFVPNNDYARLVRQRRPDAVRPGEIRDGGGRVLAQHDGLLDFTIGQRRGLGFAAGKPMYVTKLDVLSNTVLVGEREALLQSTLIADQLNWLTDPRDEPVRCAVKIRHMHTPARAVLARMGRERVRVTFDEAQSAITPGQAAVFYDQDIVLGGGWICGAE